MIPDAAVSRQALPYAPPLPAGASQAFRQARQETRLISLDGAEIAFECGRRLIAIVRPLGEQAVDDAHERDWMAGRQRHQRHGAVSSTLAMVSAGDAPPNGSHHHAK